MTAIASMNYKSSITVSTFVNGGGNDDTVLGNCRDRLGTQLKVKKSTVPGLGLHSLVFQANCSFFVSERAKV